ncbi:MAG: two-partner secretion domain-containing protein, partial [Planctomycetota bacterium]
MKLFRKILKECCFRQTIVLALTFCLLFNTSLHVAMAVENPAATALPSGVLPGSTLSTSDMSYDVVNPSDVRLDITQSSNQAIINWNNFDIGSNATVQFHQPGSMAAVLNRVHDGDTTGIMGALQANGGVFIVNPAGIIFGEGATINVAQLVASALDITDQDFIDGKYEFIAGEGIGEVINQGTITAIKGVALIGKKILNTGTIMTDPGGFVVMAAGDRVLLGKPGSDVIVEVGCVSDPAATSDDFSNGDVWNEGTIDSPGGMIVLAAGDTFSLAITECGCVEPLKSVVKAESGTGRVWQNGTIYADGIGGDGGSISLTAGDEVALGNGSLTTANAGTNGDGGDVLVLASEMATFSEGARIEAKGGSDSGDGGFFELSGGHILLAGDVDVSAVSGQGGRILLDPDTLTVESGAGTGAPDTISQDFIEAQADAVSEFDLWANYSIVVEDIGGNSTIKGGTGDMVFRTLFNTGKIQFLDSGDTITTTTGDIFMLAGDGSAVDATGIGIDIGNLLAGSFNQEADPGQVYLFTNNGGSIVTGALSSEGG